MKVCFKLLVLILLSAPLFAQTAGNRVTKTAEKVNQKAGEAAATTVYAADQLHSANYQAQTAVNAARSVVRIFEPVLRLRRRRQPAEDSLMVAGTGQAVTVADPAYATDVAVAGQAVNVAANLPFVPESNLYNPDGSANLGNQNHELFGNYIDMVRGEVLDDISVAGRTGSVDLIFTATDYFNSQVPMYALLTPAYVKNNLAAANHFRGPRYKDPNVPPRFWDVVNESEVALTGLTPMQFERIATNEQLMSVVKQVRGFAGYVESRTKLTGKVFAVKTEMAGRTCYGLLFVAEHLGTTGANGLLRVRLKVTGFDMTGDGLPDPSFYLGR